MSGLPTLVFVPGAWHKAACYDKLTKLLQQRHHINCVPVTLPSTTSNPDATFKNDVDAVRDAIFHETSRGTDVVVIAHSYGGMVGNSAIKGFSRPQGSDSSSSGHVIGLILIASGFTLTGLAFMDPFLGHPPPSWRINSETGFADLVVRPQELFYHDVPTDEADYWAAQLTPQSLKSLFEGGEFAYAGWMDVPSWYIGTVEDRGLPIAMQRMTVGMARGMGGDVQHREMQTSHSPFLSRPEETVHIIVEAVVAFSGKSVHGGPARTDQDKELAMRPEPRLWRPVTWVRFGLPLVFGRFLGKCVLAFTWGRRLWRSRYV